MVTASANKTTDYLLSALSHALIWFVEPFNKGITYLLNCFSQIKWKKDKVSIDQRAATFPAAQDPAIWLYA